MPEGKLVIRKSKRKQYGVVLLGGLLILWYFIGPYESTRIIYAQSPTFTIILGIVMFGLFFFFLNELIKRKAEIILTNEGIELRDEGFFGWEMIQSFSTQLYRGDSNDKIDLILHFWELADIKFDISDLEKDKDEITELILAYKGSTSILFAGHKD